MSDPAAPPWSDFLALDDDALLAQCEVDRFRASGPGGQKRNKTDSAVRLRHRPSGLTGEANESRSQHENRARALRRLRMTLALRLRAPAGDLEGFAPPPPLAEALRERRGQGTARLEMGKRDARYPATVAALFDLLEACEWRLSDAATLLGVSTGGLSGFLVDDDAVLREANERRRAHGHRPLRPGT
jgi:hypothetical protein